MSIERVKREQLLEDLAEKLVYYVGEGIPVDPILNASDLETKISDLDTLLEAAFITTGVGSERPLRSREPLDIDPSDTNGITGSGGLPIGVLDFVSLLHHRLRSLEPVPRKELDVLQGHTRGRVDWNETIKHRYGTGNVAGDEYACRVRRKTVESDNNRVLAALLTTLDDILSRLQDPHSPLAIESVIAEWDSGKPAKSHLTSALENVYMKQFDVDHEDISMRTIREVVTDRNPLYREAAILLREYKRIHNSQLTDKEARQLLQLDIFAPEDSEQPNSTLHELYWIFQILDYYGDCEFRPISKNHDLIAEWIDETYRYRMYNDWNGNAVQADSANGEELLSFEVTAADHAAATGTEGAVDDPGYYLRQAEISRLNFQIGRLFEDQDPDTQDDQTPDIVLLRTKLSTGEFAGVFIGDAKWSTNLSTLVGGLDQVLSYGGSVKLGRAFDQHHPTDRNYVTSNANPIESPELTLGLFVGDSDVITEEPDGNIQIRGYGDSVRDPFEDIDID